MPDAPHVELLAPAGGPQALRAAVAAGADAVYLGVESLNARRSAENFNLETLAETVRFAHLRGVRIYLTANVVILEEELDPALDMIEAAWRAGVDAVIVQDVGLMRRIREEMPGVRIHSSTQVNAHSTATITALRDLGVERVTLAREVSTAEMARFTADAPGIEIESFVHGALCMCYSGQCLLSSVIGGRSANRGQCAQPCRLPYELLGDKGPLADTPGAYLLSPKDLAGIGVLPELVAAGVSALKIEGRMKSPEYVALVTGVYRKALDRALADVDSFSVRAGERHVLEEAFSRGFSTAYLTGERGNEMMSYRRPNNRGVLLGRVMSTSGDTAVVSLDADLDSEDTVEFWTGSGRFAQRAGRLRFDGGTHSTAPRGAKVEIIAEKPVGQGDRVFRVRNAALENAARRTFEQETGSEIPLDFAVRMVVGEPVSVSVSDSQGRTGAATGSVVEPARTREVSAEDVAEHVGRLGGTPYRIAGWRLDLSPGAGIGFSAIHHVRRDALAAYEAAVLSPWDRRSFERARSAPATPPHRRRSAAPKLVASAESVEVALACLSAGAESVHVPTYALRGDVPEGVVPLSPRVCHDREFGGSLRHAASGRPFVAGTLGAVVEASRRGALTEAHWSLNALNHSAVHQFEMLGASFVWLSPELTARQIEAVAAHASVPVGIAIAGRQEVMVTEHCVLMSEGECDRRCGSCTRRASTRLLRDRKGYEFPLITDVTGRSHLYNAVPLDLTGVLDQVLGTGAAAVRVDAADLTPREAGELVSRARRALDATVAGAPFAEKAAGTTTGHFFRGVG